MYDLLTGLSHPDWISGLGEIGVWFTYRLCLSHSDCISGLEGDRCMIYLQVYHILIGLVG